MSDIFFDNFFTDMAFHSNIDHCPVQVMSKLMIGFPDKIKQSAAQVLLANQRVRHPLHSV